MYSHALQHFIAQALTLARVGIACDDHINILKADHFSFKLFVRCLHGAFTSFMYVLVTAL